MKDIEDHHSQVVLNIIWYSLESARDRHSHLKLE